MKMGIWERRVGIKSRMLGVQVGIEGIWQSSEIDIAGRRRFSEDSIHPHLDDNSGRLSLLGFFLSAFY